MLRLAVVVIAVAAVLLVAPPHRATAQNIPDGATFAQVVNVLGLPNQLNVGTESGIGFWTLMRYNLCTTDNPARVPMPITIGVLLVNGRVTRQHSDLSPFRLACP